MEFSSVPALGITGAGAMDTTGAAMKGVDLRDTDMLAGVALKDAGSAAAKDVGQQRLPIAEAASAADPVSMVVEVPAVAADTGVNARGSRI
jgi:hypothetical protein